MNGPMRCCVCRHQEDLRVTTDLPGSGWRCIDRDACRQRVHDILTQHRQLAAIMNPSAEDHRVLAAGVAILIVAFVIAGLNRLTSNGTTAEIVIVLDQVLGAIAVIVLIIGLILHFAPLDGVVDEETLKGLIE